MYRTFKENIVKLYNEDYNKDEYVEDYESLPLSLKVMTDEIIFQYSILNPSAGCDGPLSRQIASVAYIMWKMKTFM